MKKSIVLLIMVSIASFAFSQGYTNPRTTQVRGYVKKNGTYVQGHTRTQRNQTNHDNYSTRGNSNPRTQKSGSRARDYSPGAYNYGRGKTINTGPKGGQYYNNRKGDKTYVPKRKR